LDVWEKFQFLYEKNVENKIAYAEVEGRLLEFLMITMFRDISVDPFTCFCLNDEHSVDLLLFRAGCRSSFNTPKTTNF